MGSNSSAYASTKRAQRAQSSVSFTPEPPTVQTQVQETQPELPKFNPDTSVFQTDLDNPYASLFGSAAPPTAPSSVPIQAKLTVGAIGDKYEQEADTVAAQVVKTINSPKPSSSVQREEEEDELKMKPLNAIQREEEEDELKMKPEQGTVQRRPVRAQISDLQMKPLNIQRRPVGQPNLLLQMHNYRLQRQLGAEGGEVSGNLESSIQSAKGGGQSLGDSVREPMEQAMGADFSNVKVHTDSTADNLNRSLNARAFTTGSDLFFKKGEYNPGSSSGQELLAHELTHVVQQGGAIQTKRPDSQNSDSQNSDSKKDIVQTKADIHQTGADNTIQRASEGEKSWWKKLKAFLLKSWWKLAAEGLAHIGKATLLGVKSAGLITASSGALALTEIPSLVGAIANLFIGVFKGCRSILMYQGTHTGAKKTTFNALAGLEAALGFVAALGSIALTALGGGMSAVAGALKGAATGCGAVENAIKEFRVVWTAESTKSPIFKKFVGGILKASEVIIGCIGGLLKIFASILTLDVQTLGGMVTQAISAVQDLFKAGRANDDLEAANDMAKAELEKSETYDPVGQPGYGVQYVSEEEDDTPAIDYANNDLPENGYDDPMEGLDL